MSTSRINYTPRLDTTPESEAATLATVYRFVLDVRRHKKVTGQSSPSNTRKEVPDESLSKQSSLE